MTGLLRVTSALRARLRAVFRRGAVEREMHDEMARHLDEATDRLVRRGMSVPAARDAARREFGNVGYLQEESRDARGGRWVEALAGDVRFALRHFARTPLTSITLVLVLSLGIGVNSALFSIVQGVTMRPAPAVPGDDDLVRIRGTTFSRTEGKLQARELSMPEINDLTSRHETFSAVAGYAIDQMVLDAGDGTELRPDEVQFVTPNFFALLGVQPVIGPGLPAAGTDDASGAELAAVISHLLWEQLGGDSALVGRFVRINDVPVRVVGVAPPGFQGPVIASGTPSVWVPLAARAAVMRSTAHALASRDSTFLEAFARLAPNVTRERATAVVRVVATSWIPEKPPEGEPLVYASDVVPLRGLTEVTSDNEVASMIALLGTGALLVLLVACTNVSALLVGAAVARRREIAIRLSLGASRSRLVRQLVTETSLIALAGGALGIALYWAITRLIVWLAGEMWIAPDVGTIAFTALVALGTGIVFGLSPALHATRLDVSNALKDSGGGTTRSRLQRSFIVAQIVLTQPLLLALAMVVGVVVDEMGGGVDRRLASRIVRVQFGTYGGAGSMEQKLARIDEVMKRVAGLPSVEAIVPQTRAFDIADFRVHSADRGTGPRAQEAIRLRVQSTAPGFFAFQQIPMLRGRELVASDTTGRDMAVVIESDLARAYWGSADPIGKRMQMVPRKNPKDLRTAIVVGVFDTAGTSLGGEGRVYTADGAEWRRGSYLVRTAGPGTAVVGSIRQLARTMIPDIQIYGDGVLTLEQIDAKERKEVLQASGAATAAGFLVLLLASIGLYGMVALAVRQRHREIGVRVALGARPRQVIGMFFMSGVRLSMLGVVLGLPLSVVALYMITSSFGEMVPLNMPVVGAAIAAVVVAVAALASWIPARKAAAVDPLAAIRTE